MSRNSDIRAKAQSESHKRRVFGHEVSFVVHDAETIVNDRIDHYATHRIKVSGVGANRGISDLAGWMNKEIVNMEVASDGKIWVKLQ